MACTSEEGLRVELARQRFSVQQHGKLHGLQARPDLNGQVAVVLGRLRDGRYPVQVLESAESMLVKPINLERTDASPEEGRCEEGKVMRYGEWFSVQALLDRSMNDGEAAGDAFAALDARAQADVLAGRRSVGPLPADPSLPEGCPRREWVGSGGAACDGCGQSREQLWRETWDGAEADEDAEAPSDDDAIEIDVCERCKYTACENCAVHESRGTCHCKDANFGRAYPPSGDPDREWYHTGKW